MSYKRQYLFLIQLSSATNRDRTSRHDFSPAPSNHNAQTLSSSQDRCPVFVAILLRSGIQHMPPPRSARNAKRRRVVAVSPNLSNFPPLHQTTNLISRYIVPIESRPIVKIISKQNAEQRGFKGVSCNYGSGFYAVMKAKIYANISCT